MSDLLPELVQFSIPFIFILIIMAVAVVLSYGIYRQTNPQHGSFIRTFLATLRTILLISLIILFFKPKLFIQFFENKQQKIALLVDYSASMNWQDDNEKRIDSLEAGLRQIDNMISGRDVQLDKIYFNQTIINYSDSLGQPFGTTNFKMAFDYLKSKPYEMVLLLSDGIRTEGLLPQLKRFPVYTIGVGKKSPDADIFISDVEYNPVVYQNKEQHIVIKTSSINYSASNAKIYLYQGNKLLANKDISITQNGTEQDTEITFRVQQTGLQRFRVEIKPQKEDSNIQNNTFVFSQEVLKNKIRIGIFSSVPSNEHKFLKFLLSKSEDFEIFSFIRIKGQSTQNYPFDSLDVLILQGFPGNKTLQADISRINNSLHKNKAGLIVFLNDQSDIDKLLSIGIDDLNSGIIKRDNVLNTTLAPLRNNNLLLHLYNDPESNTMFFNAVPPVLIYFDLNRLKNNWQVLLSGISGGINDHLAVISDSKNQKKIIMNGAGFWRWHFSLQGDEKIRDGYQRLLTNMVRWAANKNKFQPVVLNINKKTVNPGQQIVFDGHLFDSQNNPVKNGQMTIAAQIAEQQFKIPMQVDSSGGFSAYYTPVNEGTYMFTAQGLVNGLEIGRDKKDIVVVPYNREFIRTNQDSSFLKLLSQSSGGHYYSLAGLDSLKKHFDTDNQKVLVKQEIELRFKSWLLYLIIIVAALEWSLRKKNSLP